MKIGVAVAGEAQRREALARDPDAEFLLKLADQRRFRRLAGLDLAAWELPQPRQRLAGGALGQQHAPVRIDERAGGNEKNGRAHGCRTERWRRRIMCVIPAPRASEASRLAPVNPAGAMRAALLTRDGGQTPSARRLVFWLRLQRRGVCPRFDLLPSRRSDTSLPPVEGVICRVRYAEERAGALAGP